MVNEERLKELESFFNLGRPEYIECYNYFPLTKEDVYTIYEAASNAKQLISSFDWKDHLFQIDENSIKALHSCVCAVKTCLRPLSAWQRENAVHLVYQFLQHFRWQGKEPQYEEYDEWGPIIFELSPEQLGYYLWWREEARLGVIHQTNRSYMWLYIYDIVLNTCYSSPKESICALETLYDIYHIYAPIKTRKHLNRQKLGYIITNYAIYNNEIHNIQKLIDNYGFDDYYPIYHSISTGRFDGTEAHILSLSSQDIRSRLYDNPDDKEFILKILSPVLNEVYKLCKKHCIDIGEQICGQLNDHVLWNPYETAILSTESAVHTTSVDTHKSFRVGWNYYYFAKCVDLSSSKGGVNTKYSIYKNDNGERVHRNGFYYRYEYAGPTSTGRMLIDYIVREIQVNYRMLVGKRKIKEVNFPYMSTIKNEIDERIKLVVSNKFGDSKNETEPKSIQNMVQYEPLSDDAVYVPERFQYVNATSSPETEQNATIVEIENKRRGERYLMDIKKYQVLKDNFKILKDSYTGHGDSGVLYTLADKIIIPMLEEDINEGIKMWEYVLSHYYEICYPVHFSTLTDHIVDNCDFKVLTQVFRENGIIKQYVFQLDRYKSHLHCEWFIRDVILMEDFAFANELINLYIQNNNGENDSQANLASLLHWAISSSESKWKITSKGIDYLNSWIPKVESNTKRAELEVAMIDLIDCVEGNASKGAIPFHILMEKGGLQLLMEDRLKKDKNEHSSSEIESSSSYDEYMKERELNISNSKSNNANSSSASAESRQINTEDLSAIMSELNELIGLQEVKSEISSLINIMRIRQIRAERGLKSATTSQHLVFSGNPGTGKTTVARIIGKVYHALGFLSKGHLIETDRSGLVAGYVGQTAIKTQEVIQSALGGVLFIDEAYTLAPERTENDFGQEAIDTLLKAMEDNRDDFVVIVAGYDNLMPRFINSNPGLKSRFSKYIYFPDYNGNELFSIFKMLLQKNDYRIQKDAEKFVESYLNDLYQNRDDNFGNARDVRNLFEKIVAYQANRVVSISNPTNEDIITICIEDLECMESRSFSQK